MAREIRGVGEGCPATKTLLSESDRCDQDRLPHAFIDQLQNLDRSSFWQQLNRQKKQLEACGSECTPTYPHAKGGGL